MILELEKEAVDIVVNLKCPIILFLYLLICVHIMI